MHGAPPFHSCYRYWTYFSGCVTRRRTTGIINPQVPGFTLPSRQGKLTEAIEVYLQALDQWVGQPVVVFALANALIQAGR
jgi:hypothetical protein